MDHCNMASKPITVEACVTSEQEASACFASGARRIELCRDLDVGGLTPARSEVASTLKKATGRTSYLFRDSDSKKYKNV